LNLALSDLWSCSQVSENMELSEQFRNDGSCVNIVDRTLHGLRATLQRCLGTSWVELVVGSHLGWNIEQSRGCTTAQQAGTDCRPSQADREELLIRGREVWG